MTANPLPNHDGPNVNTIMEELGTQIKMKVDEVKSLMDEVYNALVEIGVIPEMKIFKGNYSYCRKASLNHIIGECEKFKALLQRMMDQG